MNRNKLGLVCMLLLINMCLCAQSSNAFLVHLNKPYYITGETVWYKVYCPAEAAGSQFAIKGLLANSDGEIVQRFFHKSIDGAHFSGHIDLPYNYDSGLYQLVFRINPRDEEEETTIADIAVPVYNDLSYGTPAASEQVVLDTHAISLDELQLSISLPNTPIQGGTKVAPQISIVDADGNPVRAELSVTVISADVQQSEEWGYHSLSEGAPLESTLYQSALSNAYVTGHVYKEDETPLQANVLGAYASNQNKIYYTKSNAAGHFTLSMDDFYLRQTVQFLPYHKEATSLKVKLKEDQVDPNQSAHLIYNEVIETALENSRLRKKIAQHFTALQSRSTEQDYVNIVQKLTPNYIFRIDEYEKFDRVYDFFTELMTPLEFRKADGKYLASMSNPKATRVQFFKLGGSPLFIVDGKATTNSDYVAQLSMSNIESIEIYYDPDELRRQFNVLGNGGVVKINTIIPVFDLPEDDKDDLFEVKGLQQKAMFSSFVDGPESRQPHFDPVQYWNPSIASDEVGQTSFEFLHNDGTGEFIIVVVAQDERGRRGRASLHYNVQIR